MAETTASAVSFRFGRFELQPRERRLLDDGTPQHLGPHAFDVLVALVERAGQLVTKDELLRRVWGRVLVEENTLQAHVSALRKVLGGRAIATVSGRGYRFDAPVVEVRQAARTLRKHNLPYPLTSFVGRETVLEELEGLLSRSRLLTMTGAGGCGKTRLAIQLARQRATSYADGAWLVELAALTDGALLPQTIVTALGAQEKSGERLVDTLADYLSSRTLLLVLDNAEHLIQECAELAVTLLQRCANLVVVVTSREPLSVTGETVYRVPSLSVPDESSSITPEAVSACEAARLFIDRARLQQPRFEVTEQNAGAVAAVCRKLDGIALALELAAPRVRTLSVEELNRGLERRFDLLDRGSRAALPRHRTLRALIDWSFDLLDDAEKETLRQVSVFAGGWTLEAARNVCILAAGSDRFVVRALLSSLVDKNLVVAEMRDGQTRYGMLETARHYANEQIATTQERAQLRRRHTRYYLELAERVDKDRSATSAAVTLRQFETEINNLRAALEDALGRPEDDEAIRLAGAACWFWVVRGYVNEGARWVNAALDTTGARANPSLCIAALRGACTLAQRQSDHETARGFADRLLAIGTRSGDPRELATAWQSLGLVAHSSGDLDTATDLYRKSLAAWRELADPKWTSILLSTLGQVDAAQGRLDDADRHLTESVALARTTGEWGMHIALRTLGLATYRLGDFARSRACLEEALEMSRALRDWSVASSVLQTMGVLAVDSNDPGRALELFREAIAIDLQLGQPQNTARSVLGFADIAAAQADHALAARLWGYGFGALARVGVKTGGQRDVRKRLFDEARARLGNESFERIWKEGGQLTIDEATMLALDLRLVAGAAVHGHLRPIAASVHGCSDEAPQPRSDT